jgi:hypothetical protein
VLIGLRWPLLLLVQGALRYLGSPVCPTPSEVDDQLKQVAPELLQSPERRLVLIEKTRDALAVRLYQDEGVLIAEKTIPGVKTCLEQARIVAALLASWTSDVTVSGLPPPALLTVQPAAAPEPRPQEPVAPAVTATVNVDETAHWLGELGAGAGGSIAGNGTAAVALELLAGLYGAKHPFGVQLSFSGTGTRSLTVGDGMAQWQRFAGGVGGSARFGSRTLKLEVDAELLAGLLTASGHGYLVSNSTSTFDAGVALSSRLTWSVAGGFLTWLQVGVSIWPGTQYVQVVSGSTPVDSERIPPVDFWLALGGSIVGGI